MSRLFLSGCRNIGASALPSVLPMNVQGWFTFQDWFDLLAVQRESQASSPTLQFTSVSSSGLSFSVVQLSHPYTALERQYRPYTRFLSALAQDCS